MYGLRAASLSQLLFLMNTECNHIADQLFSTLNGEAWYGDSMQRILDGVTCEQALSHPIPSAHSIWELVLHVDAWCKFAYGAVQGISMPAWPDMSQAQDFPSVIDRDQEAWQQALQSLFANHLILVEAIKGFGDSRLEATVPGRPYRFYRLFQSMTQHAVYHAGQIALLKKALR
jgi:DinB superfamily